MYRAVLRRPAFRRLWLGATVSLLGDALTFTALIWLVYDLTGSKAQVGYLVATMTAPVVVGGPLAGIALDRIDRRRVLVADSLVRGAAVGAVPLLASLGLLRTWELFLVAALHGLLKMVPLAGVPSLIPDLVDDAGLEAANGLESVSFALASVAGPAAAGVLIAAAGAANVLVLDAASYVLLAVALLGLPQLGTAERAASGSLREAFAFVVGVPVLLATTVMFMLANVGEAALEVVLPVYAGTPVRYGILASAAGAGLLAGSIAAGAVPGRVLLIGVCELLGGVLLLPLALRPGLPLSVVVLAAASACVGTLTVWAQSIRMRLLPPHLRGRAFALLRTAMQGTPPAGALLAGSLSGIAATIVVAAAAIGLPGLAGPLLRGRETDGVERPVQRHVQPPVTVEEQQ